MKNDSLSKAIARSAITNATDAGRRLFPRGPFFLLVVAGLALGIFAAMAAHRASASAADDQKAVAALDTEYQAAVKINDAATMARLLADDFVLVTGSGKTYTKTDLVKEARDGRDVYEHNEDTDRTVRVWGDTAVITAKLWEKGATDGKPFDRVFWFSDTYVRTPTGWKYVFAQSSLPPPKPSK